MGTLNDQRNRSVCGAFLSQLAGALATKARATAADPASKPLALAILRGSSGYAVRFAPTIAADPTVNAVAATVPLDATGQDTGNGWSYPVPDVTLTAAVETAWPLLIEIGV